MGEDLPLEAKGLAKTYRGPFGRRSVRALEEFDIAVAPGTIHGLVGPNGSGKTTAIRCMLGLLRSTRGEVRRFGREVTSADRAGVGYAPERFDLAGKRSGRETLSLLGRLSGMTGAALSSRVDEELERLELTAAAARPLSSYSKGMVRRVSIASALLVSPRLLVLDEPFDGLDPIGNQAVRDEVQRRARAGCAVLLSTHALADLEAVATHLTIVNAGRVLAQGEADETLSLEGRTELVLDALDEDGLRAVREAVASAGGSVVRQRSARESLVDLFRRRISGRDEETP